MVFYTCSGCGESLKKNKVEKHVAVCRSCEYLTCIDCSKDFWGDDYKSHTSCISEEEKYAATGFKAKPNKGDTKQKDWLQKVEQAASQCKNASSEAKELLESLQDYGNIPRKKTKFLNFLRNSLKVRNNKLVEEVWEIFSAAKSNPVETNKENSAAEATTEPVGNTAEPSKKKKRKLEKSHPESEASKVNVEPNGSCEESSKQRKKKKRKMENSSEGEPALKRSNAEMNGSSKKSSKLSKKMKRKMENAANAELTSKNTGGTEVNGADCSKKRKKKKLQNNADSESAPEQQVEEDNANADVNGDYTTKKFPWNKAIRLCLKAASDREMPLKKLQKKVLAEYAVFDGQKRNESENEVRATFMKKVNKNPKFLVSKDRVRLK